MRTAFMCEKCKKLYDTYNEAEKCEDSHAEPTGVEYSYCKGHRFPNRIKCTFGKCAQNYVAVCDDDD